MNKGLLKQPKDVASLVKYSSNWKIKAKRNDKKILRLIYSIKDSLKQTSYKVGLI